MSVFSSSYPRTPGAATATTSVNDYKHIATEINVVNEPGAAFYPPAAATPNGHPFSGKNEKLCRIFSPLGASWDYSEVD
jgi:hypothetical protein